MTICTRCGGTENITGWTGADVQCPDCVCGERLEATPPDMLVAWSITFGDTELAATLAGSQTHWNAMCAAGWHASQAAKQGDFVGQSMFEQAADEALACSVPCAPITRAERADYAARLAVRHVEAAAQ